MKCRRKRQKIEEGEWSEQQGRNGEENTEIRYQEREILREGKGTRARRKIENKIMEKRLILCHRMAKKHMYVELVSEVACGLVPALKQREKMNTDRERRTGKEDKKTNKCQASIKSGS